jgi:hypothetical protein
LYRYYYFRRFCFKKRRKKRTNVVRFYYLCGINIFSSFQYAFLFSSQLLDFLNEKLHVSWQSKIFSWNQSIPKSRNFCSCETHAYIFPIFSSRQGSRRRLKRNLGVINMTQKVSFLLFIRCFVLFYLLSSLFLPAVSK